MNHRIEQPSTILLKPIQVSPRGFKRQIETVLSALVQLGIRATIVAKLPQGSSWSADLQRYSSATHPAPDIYLLNRNVANPNDWHRSILIPSTVPMQGEYFLLVVSETIGFLLQGQRQSSAATAEEPNTAAGTETSQEAESWPKVDYRVTFQRPLIQAFINELAETLQASQEEYSDQTFLSDLLAEWETQISPPEYCHPALVDAILLQEGGGQERLQQQARAYRRQAMTASSLSTQNESLLNTIRIKDDFLSKVGQELKTPLSTIKTALPLLSSPNLKPIQRQRYLDMISRECDRQVTLIHGVLEMLQIEHSLMTVRPEPIHLFDILPGVVSTYQPIAQEKGVRLAYTVPNTLPAVCCPENWVRQIVIHLLSNSIRFTNPGGEVWVTAQPHADESLLINIKDSGVGIPANELPHIFEHFYQGRQANSAEGGVGLGLAIVRQLLLYCDGQISVDSQPDVGTNVKVTLPLHTPS